MDVIRGVVGLLPASRLEARGVGSFPSGGRRPRVLWVGCGGDLERLAAAVTEADGALHQIGWERERRPFQPHLTLGRVRDGRRGGEALTTLLDEFREEPFGVWKVDEWVLYQSELQSTGAVYHRVGRFPLAE